jgi:hypothetical protein
MRHVGTYIRRRAAAVLTALAIVGVATGSAEASSAARNDAPTRTGAVVLDGERGLLDLGSAHERVRGGESARLGVDRPELTSSYRGHGVNHEPGSHTGLAHKDPARIGLQMVARRERRKGADSPAPFRDQVFYLVAGAGFEPATFGL